MKSRVELDIQAPQAQLAELFADPRNNLQWMDDIERIEPIHGELGQPGSIYRMVPKRGDMVFVATVVRRVLPTQVSLSLNDPRVSVAITDTFRKLSDTTTCLISDEVFTFHGRFGKLVGFMSRRAIRRAHRRHMESFKRFAERQLYDVASLTTRVLAPASPDLLTGDHAPSTSAHDPRASGMPNGPDARPNAARKPRIRAMGLGERPRVRGRNRPRR